MTLHKRIQTAVEEEHCLVWCGLHEVDNLFHAHQAWAVREAVNR